MRDGGTTDSPNPLSSTCIAAEGPPAPTIPKTLQEAPQQMSILYQFQKLRDTEWGISWARQSVPMWTHCHA